MALWQRQHDHTPRYCTVKQDLHIEVQVMSVPYASDSSVCVVTSKASHRQPVVLVSMATDNALAGPRTSPSVYAQKYIPQPMR